MHEEITQLFVEAFFPDEAISKCLKMATDEVSLQEYCLMVTHALKQNVSLVVLEESDAPDKRPQLVGTMVLAVLCKEDVELLPEFHGEAMQKIWRMLMRLRWLQEGGNGDPLMVHGLSAYLCDVGMCVRRDRRQRGLGLALLRALPELCRSFAIPHFSTPFTGASSQKLAEKADFKEFSKVLYAEMKEKDGSPSFPGIPEIYCKLMGFDTDLSALN